MKTNVIETGTMNTTGTIEVIEKTTPFQGYFRIDRYRFRHSLFNGGLSGEITREVFERGHAAAVLPFDPKTGEIILIEQFRAGALAASMPPWLLEVIAGIIEENETPENMSHREAQEEAGCDLGRLKKIGTFLMTPGGSSETITLFCGETLRQEQRSSYGLEEEGEDIRTHMIKAEDAFQLMREGAITNAITAIALQWLELNQKQLVKEWQ
ncbi:NUDIX domain-containing protein [Kiloniella laminariae]|uniref:ADP-ribose pyrophosphatase n=1 Tax=Kiloniella laminariae TaxID=454162 RepID=A0ABT4LNC3_9PROT|nr:NUDIX domain-containing protein [Kiloniella laminariae]MCZ4282650.1 NUDIX domain-containing protein [Kiloniella laminariae]